MATLNDDAFEPLYDKGDKKTKNRLVGLELEVERIGTLDEKTKTWEDLNRMDIVAGIGFDATDMEIMTQPISDTLIHKSAECMNPIFKYIETKTVTDKRGGTHINVSKLRGDSKYTLENLMWMAMIYKEQFEKVFGRISHWSRSPINLGYVKDNLSHTRTLRKSMEIFFKDQSRMFKKLCRTYPKHFVITDKKNRYEFRGGKASNNKLECLAWSEFCLNIVNMAAENKKNFKFQDLLKGDYIERYINEEVQKSKTRKLTKEDLTRSLLKAKRITITQPEDKLYK